MIPFKKDPSIASFGTAANISKKNTSDSNIDLRNFRQHYSELHTNVLPPAIAQDYCKALSFETFTATKLELCVRLDLRTKEEGYLDSKIDLRTY